MPRVSPLLSVPDHVGTCHEEPADVTDTTEALLARTAQLAADYIATAPDRPVTRTDSAASVRAALGGSLGEAGEAPLDVIERLAKGVSDGLVVTTAGRFFGFVEGGVLPASLAADWLAATWDQNPGLFALSPAAAVVEEICAEWLVDLLRLPPTASVGITTGAQMANFVGLAAGRRKVLEKAGWDVDGDGLFSAPEIHVVVGAERHITIGRALRYLGLGERRVTVVPADDQGRMDADALAGVLDDRPTIVCAQAGNVNTGAFDPLRRICDIAHERSAWVHVDGAFGLWAAAAPGLQHLIDGVELADSWSTDGHKWLNVPYDCGFAICADPESHRNAMAVAAAYLVRQPGRQGTDWSPESSRRARAFSVWAALRSLGRTGVARMIERSCEQARRFAEALAEHEGFTIINDVVLNQVMVRVKDDDALTHATAARLQAGGDTWMGATTWHDRAALRISVSDHATTDDDVDAAVAAIVSAAAAAEQR